jgi:hypothetical protein
MRRRAAFDGKGLEAPLDTFIKKVAEQPARITDEDVGAARALGRSEDQIFELVICAAVGQSSRHYESALEALDQARNEGGGADEVKVISEGVFKIYRAPVGPR